jgi:hypothetical protein
MDKMKTRRNTTKIGGIVPLILFIATVNIITTVAAAEEKGKRSLLRVPGKQEEEEEEQRSLGVNNGLCLQHSIEDCASQTVIYRGEEVNCCACTKIFHASEERLCVIGTSQFTAGWDFCSDGCLDMSS